MSTATAIYRPQVSSYDVTSWFGLMDGSKVHVRYCNRSHEVRTRAVTDASGNAIEGTDCYPFGLVKSGRQSLSGDPTKEGFTSKERDAETGLDYFGARYLGEKIMPAFSGASSFPVFGDPSNSWSEIINDNVNIQDSKLSEGMKKTLGFAMFNRDFYNPAIQDNRQGSEVLNGIALILTPIDGFGVVSVLMGLSATATSEYANRVKKPGHLFVTASYSFQYDIEVDRGKYARH